MESKIEHPPQAIDSSTFSKGTVLSSATIHLTGGLRAEYMDGGWSIRPIISPSGLGAFRPFPRSEIDRFASLAGLRVIGGEQISDLYGPLPTRIWTPLYETQAPAGSAADLWAAIAAAASRSGDVRGASIARNIAVTLNAASVRVRDASDCYNTQLLAALMRQQTVGRRFRNVPALDLLLAFHSLLSEMASARDHIAAFAGLQLGAPDSVDALNRFEAWAGAESRKDKAAAPLAAALLGSREPGASNAWLRELTEYRNLVIHKTPLAAIPEAGALIVVERQVELMAIRTIEMQIPDFSDAGRSCDALTKLVGLHENLLALARLAAEQAAYSTAPPAFIVQAIHLNADGDANGGGAATRAE